MKAKEKIAELTKEMDNGFISKLGVLLHQLEKEKAREVILWIEEEIENNWEAGISIGDNDKIKIISELLIKQIIEEAKENYAYSPNTIGK